MKAVINQLIDDFYERELPALIPRDRKFAEIKGKADAVIGMRRAGKTWFCFQKMTELLSAGIEKSKILYLNFEDDRLLRFDIDQFQNVLDAYFGKYPEHRDTKCYFFFDEIQRIDQWEIFIRRILDSENVQVYLTGSSSKLLSVDIATSLRGRSLPIEIFPFSFPEFLRYHGYFQKIPKTFGAKTNATLRKAATDYLEIGGFPEVQKIERNLRVEVLQGYIDAVLLKDIIERHGVGNISALKHMVRSVIDSPGGKFSVNKFYNTLRSMAVKCTKNNLYDYLDHLFDAFVFSRVPIHTRSEKVRIINPGKIYTIDTGLSNAMAFRNSSDYGPLLENMVFMHLRRKGDDIEYVRTKDGYETDFFVRDKLSGDVKLIQVCWDISNKKTFEREMRGLKSAMTELRVASGTIVTWDDDMVLEEEKIDVVPVWKWLLE